MTAWIYVLGIWNRKSEEMRFEHIVVMAPTQTQAYAEGARKAEEAGLLPIKHSGESANDYVIQLVAN